MCGEHGDNEYPVFETDKWRRARKAHRCYACHETILAGGHYHVVTGLWNSEILTFKHCARCWTMFEKLIAERDQVEFGLDCGEVYEGDDPDMLALAFATPAEAQAFVPAGKR